LSDTLKGKRERTVNSGEEFAKVKDGEEMRGTFFVLGEKEMKAGP
jgi:hypothetical protein